MLGYRSCETSWKKKSEMGLHDQLKWSIWCPLVVGFIASEQLDSPSTVWRECASRQNNGKCTIWLRTAGGSNTRASEAWHEAHSRSKYFSQMFDCVLVRLAVSPVCAVCENWLQSEIPFKDPAYWCLSKLLLIVEYERKILCLESTVSPWKCTTIPTLLH